MKLADDKVAALKTATHALLGRLGGLAAAATVCRVSVPVLSEYQSLNHRERIMPLDVALQLETVAGEPIVSGAVARMQGWTLVRPEAGVVPEIGRSVAALSRHAGETGARFLEANADGVLDAGETAELRRQIEAVRDSAEAALARLGAAPGLKVVA
jgi:hypothetical protein